MGAEDAPTLLTDADRSPSKSSPSKSSPSRSATSEADEKARLETLVCAFTSRALKGCPCTCLRDATGKRAATRYRIDKELKNFIFEASGSILKKEVKVPLNR